MYRRRFLGLMIATLVGSGPAFAQSLEDRLIGQLRAQGFDRFSVSRTWLGRTRIEAVGSDQRREIIFNPRTGEILRDYWQQIGDGSEGGIISSGSSRPGSSNDDDDDDDDGNGGGGGGGGSDDDDGDDDDDGEDNSGSGSGNSGKG